MTHSSDARVAPVIPEVREIRCFAGSLIAGRVFVSTFWRSREPLPLLHCFDLMLKLSAHPDVQVRLEVIDALARVRASNTGRLQLEISAQPIVQRSE